MSEQKTHAEIINEMRFHGQQNINAEKAKREYGILTYEGRLHKNFADELDAAHKREMDALMDEMNEQIADLRQQRDLWSQRAAELVEKCNEQYAKLKRAGNAGKLREALEEIIGGYENADLCDMNYGEWCHDPANVCVNFPLCKAIHEARAALAKPPRQCDVGTAEEQGKRFTAFCYKNRNAERCCGDCPAFNKGGFAECELAWAQMPYEEGGAK